MPDLSGSDLSLVYCVTAKVFTQRFKLWVSRIGGDHVA